MKTTPAAPVPPPVNPWAGDSSQWSQERKLDSLAPAFRSKVKAVLKELCEVGFLPKIVFGWRSVKVQKKLRAQGKSTLSFSFHCGQYLDGTPCSWAADIIDTRYGYNEVPGAAEFWAALGASAKAQGLVWGGDWKSFRDVSHIQGRQNSELAAVKRESGLA